MPDDSAVLEIFHNELPTKYTPQKKTLEMTPIIYLFPSSTNWHICIHVHDIFFIDLTDMLRPSIVLDCLIIIPKI